MFVCSPKYQITDQMVKTAYIIEILNQNEILQLWFIVLELDMYLACGITILLLESEALLGFWPPLRALFLRRQSLALVALLFSPLVRVSFHHQSIVDCLWLEIWWNSPSLKNHWYHGAYPNPTLLHFCQFYPDWGRVSFLFKNFFPFFFWALKKLLDT